MGVVLRNLKSKFSLKKQYARKSTRTASDNESAIFPDFSSYFSDLWSFAVDFG